MNLRSISVLQKEHCNFKLTRNCLFPSNDTRTRCYALGMSPLRVSAWLPLKQTAKRRIATGMPRSFSSQAYHMSPLERLCLSA
ncbi:hypothetical protein PR048_028044 [Dryococelus australis]|uniref:Uncharacterized protein n=1 Tax=Dryococelus australis TaxID=614101 RepID=A0ABQ9GI58_9NEOP|nr:hypothetical protein PR048_028044 [Dryococelus australis]